MSLQRPLPTKLDTVPTILKEKSLFYRKHLGKDAFGTKGQLIYN